MQVTRRHVYLHYNYKKVAYTLSVQVVFFNINIAYNSEFLTTE